MNAGGGFPFAPPPSAGRITIAPERTEAALVKVGLPGAALTSGERPV